MAISYLKNSNSINFWLKHINNDRPIDEFVEKVNSIPPDARKKFIDQADGSGKNLWLTSTSKAKIEWVDFLLENNVDIKHKDESGWDFIDCMYLASFLNSKTKMDDMFLRIMEKCSLNQFSCLMDVLSRFEKMKKFDVFARMLTNKPDLFKFLNSSPTKKDLLTSRLDFSIVSSALASGNITFLDELKTNLDWDIFEIVKKNQSLAPLIFVISHSKSAYFWSYDISKPFISHASTLPPNTWNDYHEFDDFPLNKALFSNKKSKSSNGFLIDFLLSVGADPYINVPSDKKNFNICVKNHYSNHPQSISLFDSAVSKYNLKNTVLPSNKEDEKARKRKI